MHKRKKKQQKIFLLKQKICGLFWIVIAIVSYFIDKDATLALIAIPFGLYLIFTKRVVMDFGTTYYTKKIHKSKVLFPLKIVSMNPVVIDAKMEEYLKRVNRILENS